MGVDVIAPPKKCTFNCIYCQLGETKIQVSTPEMLKEPLVIMDEVSSDLDDVLKRIDLETVDIVTFSGSGEPTLNLDLGKIAQRVKAKIGTLPTAILTNSSLFYREDVRRNLSGFNLVVAKLDAGDDETLRLINRPVDSELRIGTITDSIKMLKKGFKGSLALEVMLLQSQDERVTNIEGEHLRNLIDAIVEVKPDVVQLEVPYRPPSESHVKEPPQERLRQISRDLSEALGEEKLWTYGIHDRRGRSVAWLKHESLEKEVLDLLTRRPCRPIDISVSLGIDLPTAEKIVRSLEKRAQVNVRIVKDGQFYFERQ